MAIKSNPSKSRLVGAALTNLCTVLIAANLQASEQGRTSGYEVTVCIESGITRESELAQSITRKMFADIGVSISFHEADKCPTKQDRIIHIHLETGVPAERFPGALAFAMPYEGVHIQVFVDRIRKMVDPKRTAVLLAHVLAHEITHILQGVNRHSPEGIMKAKWDQEDFQKRCWEPLTFTEKDIKLIYIGLEARKSLSAAKSSITSK